MLILDFDLDFIVRPIRRGAADQAGRYDGPNVTIWPQADFHAFLKAGLHLSQSQKVRGQACEHHKEVFFHTESLIRSRSLVTPLHWVHIDAHDDILGCSDRVAVNSANFILHLIGRGWLGHLDFVLPRGEERPPECLIRWDPLRIEFGSHRCTIDFLDQDNYRLPKTPDFVFLTRSPDFTPPAADLLFDLARSYIAA